MSPEQVFSIVNFAALPGWAALALAPLRRDLAVLAARVVVAALAAVYLAALVGGMLGVGADSGRPAGMPDYTTLAGVVALLGNPFGATIGWTHFLAFDLFVGAWQVEIAGRRNIPHWMVLPCLALTFMFGPIGLLAFFGVLALRRRPA